MKVYFIQQEIEAAAQYILTNNPAAKSLNWTYDTVYDTINKLFIECHKQAKENPDELPLAATMGAVVIGDFVGDDLYISVTVKPYFGDYEISRMA